MALSVEEIAREEKQGETGEMGTTLQTRIWPWSLNPFYSQGHPKRQILRKFPQSMFTHGSSEALLSPHLLPSTNPSTLPFRWLPTSSSSSSVAKHLKFLHKTFVSHNTIAQVAASPPQREHEHRFFWLNFLPFFRVIRETDESHSLKRPTRTNKSITFFFGPNLNISKQFLAAPSLLNIATNTTKNQSHKNSELSFFVKQRILDPKFSHINTERERAEVLESKLW